MSSYQEYRQAFDNLYEGLQQTIERAVHVLHTHGSASIRKVIEQQLEHTLERTAHLYGKGMCENVSVSALFNSAIHNEALLAYEYQHELQNQKATLSLERQGELTAATDLHLQRARALMNAARRGTRLTVYKALPHLAPYRGVYVRPFTPEVRTLLAGNKEPFVHWKEGVIAAVPVSLIESLRASEAQVTILFLDADELYNLDDQPQFYEELSRRLAIAEADANRQVGEALERHINRLLLHQSNVLRNLRPRLLQHHVVAHQALQPILKENCQLLMEGLRAHATWIDFRGSLKKGTLAQLISQERKLRDQALTWLSHKEIDSDMSLFSKFEDFLERGTLLEELERAHQTQTMEPP